MKRVVKWGCLSILVAFGLFALIAWAIGDMDQEAATKGTTAATNGKPSKAVATPTPQPRIGDTVTVGNWQYQVTKSEQQQSTQWGSLGSATQAKGAWQVVHIKVQNVGKQTYPLNAWDFEVRDGAGITYKADSFASSMYSQYAKLSKPMDNYPPGVQAEIGVVFDINPDAQGLQLYLVQARTLIGLSQ